MRAYSDTYLKEEIWNEQVIRKLLPFRRFLEVAAQSNGKIINYANISRDVGVDENHKRIFFVLEDTLIGFFLEPFHNSFRKRLVEKPKFYFLILVLYGVYPEGFQFLCYLRRQLMGRLLSIL